MDSASFSSFEEVYENLDDFDDLDEEAKTPGPHLLATCAARGQARSSEGVGSSPATMEASSNQHSEVEELQVVSEIAVGGSQDASCASKRGPPAHASCGIAASAVPDVKGCHRTKEDAEVQFHPPSSKIRSHSACPGQILGVYHRFDSLGRI
jgi:hypothetical protein